MLKRGTEVVLVQGAGEDEYTVYIHARPRFMYTKNTTKCSAFIDRQLKKPVLVQISVFCLVELETVPGKLNM